MKSMRQQNLAKDAYKDEKTSEMIRKVESLEIKDGKIVLKVRAKPAGSSDGASKKAAPVEVVPPGNGQPKTEPPKSVEPTPAKLEPTPTKTAAPKP